jgi:hypothetical protein
VLLGAGVPAGSDGLGLGDAPDGDRPGRVTAGDGVGEDDGDGDGLDAGGVPGRAG